MQTPFAALHLRFGAGGLETDPSPVGAEMHAFVLAILLLLGAGARERRLD